MKFEIDELAVLAQYFLDNHFNIKLPKQVPYLGMGSSFIAPLAFKYIGIDIYPELATEYYYLDVKKKKLAVLISQSGTTKEVLECSRNFDTYIAITNYPSSKLCTHSHGVTVLPLLAGNYEYSSAQTYINTLLALFCGFEINVNPVVKLLHKYMDYYSYIGKQMADIIYKYWLSYGYGGVFITGSGPNVATAHQAALILCESTKFLFTGITFSQYFHGYNLTEFNSFVIHIVSNGKSYNRTLKSVQEVSNINQYIFQLNGPELLEHESIIHNIVPFNYMANYLVKNLEKDK